MRVLDYVLLGRTPHRSVFARESRHDLSVAGEVLKDHAEAGVLILVEDYLFFALAHRHGALLHVALELDPQAWPVHGTEDHLTWNQHPDARRYLTLLAELERDSPWPDPSSVTDHVYGETV